MKTLMVLAVSTCLAWVPAQAQSSTEERDTQSKLIALEQVVRVQALPSKDVKTLEMFLADEFVLVTLEGRMESKAETFANIQELNSLHYVMNEVQVRVHGSTAIATGLFRMSGVQRGKPFVRQGRFLDTWLNHDGRWLLISSLSTPTG
ncbi:MAG TPA: nuclear transport factor 2 family protein [Candidatus Sulfotelmatobacter sp.]|nr:nuclear transport factor 2 family protein [Candidatus Sulfotelmatobacter sp.]